VGSDGFAMGVEMCRKGRSRYLSPGQAPALGVLQRLILSRLPMKGERGNQVFTVDGTLTDGRGSSLLPSKREIVFKQRQSSTAPVPFEG
jgi:hypothetical protein